MRLLLALVFISFSLNAQTLLKEEFNTLDNWEPLYFDKIDSHTKYEIKDSILLAKSDASASGLKFKKSYDIYKFPKLSFKWKVNNVYKKGDATTKAGDDYPIRIYVMFEYNPEEAGFFEQVKYDFAKSIYGEYPPHSTVNYIWSNKVQKEKYITSAYTNRAKMIVTNSASKNLNTWQEHTVNVLEDYKKAFGENPPRRVSLAIMSDSDNTKEKTLAYVDFIEVKDE